MCKFFATIDASSHGWGVFLAGVLEDGLGDIYAGMAPCQADFGHVPLLKCSSKSQLAQDEKERAALAAIVKEQDELAETFGCRQWVLQPLFLCATSGQ